MAELHVENLSVTVGDQRLVDMMTLRVKAGELVALIGPNGAGKSTLLRAIAGVQSFIGTAQIDDQDITAMDAIERARCLAWLPQSPPAAWPVSVREAVAIGRFAWSGGHRPQSSADRRTVHDALVRCQLSDFADRPVTSLSGGELARVHLARGLVAEAPVLLADEPVAALDPAHQLAVMQILRDCASAGKAIVVVLHDIALAARFADRIVAMLDGRLVGAGSPRTIITGELLTTLYGVKADIHWDAGVPIPLYSKPR